MKLLVKNSNFEWEVIANGIDSYSKDIVTSKNWKTVSLHHILIKPGGEITIHKHDNVEEAHFVISGQAKAIVSGKEYEIFPGDVIIAEKSISHGVKNHTNHDFYMLCVFNPPLV